MSRKKTSSERPSAARNRGLPKGILIVAALMVVIFALTAIGTRWVNRKRDKALRTVATAQTAKKDKKDKQGADKPKSEAKTDKPDEKNKDKKNAGSIKDDAPPRPFDPEHPVMVLEGLRCQVHREGDVRQEIRAASSRYDETEKLLEMTSLNVLFRDQGTTLGQVVCGSGRIWTGDRPSQGVSAHDMVMERNVRLQTSDRGVLTTPEMRYLAAQSLLTSNKGYQNQFPLGKSYLVGRGQGFEIKLLLEKNTLESWKWFGDPAHFEKSEKPVLEP